MEKNREKELSIILPVFNGAKSIRQNIEALYKFAGDNCLDLDLIVVNDGSTDDTLKQLDALKTTFPKLKVISYSKNQGKGYAIKTGAPHTEKNYVVLMDADLPASIDLQNLDNMIHSLHNGDIIIASRYHHTAQLKRKWHRLLVSKCHRQLVQLFFPKLQTTDPDVGFKAYKRNALLQIVPKTNLNHWSWDLQALVCATTQGFTIYEVPFHWIEEYENTTVSLIRDSISEFCGILYIKSQLITGKFKN